MRRQILGYLLGGLDDDEIERLEAELKERFASTDLYITRSLSYFCEILHPDGGKDKALNWLCESNGIQSEETIAFGNGYNDVQMLEWAGYSVAIGGAVPQVLEVADTVAPPIEEDGAAQVIEGLLDRGLIG
jgi:hydroxymethylpyrimidine pyrophosphatase-like HAD family hydrolase